jgi:hypothetical protein
VNIFQVDPLSSGLTRSSSNKNNNKKSFASRISNQFERFKRSSSADKSQSNRVVNHGLQNGGDGFSPHFRPRRTFYNVMPPRNVVAGSMRGPSASRRYYVHPPVSASVTPSWMAKNGVEQQPQQPHQQPQQQQHFVHRPLCVDLDNTMAINGNVCLCETSDGNGRLCRRCGLERQVKTASKVDSWWRDWLNSPFDHHQQPQKKAMNNEQLLMRRSQSEESVSTTNNPYEAMRKQRLSTSTNINPGSRYVSGWNDNSDPDENEVKTNHRVNNDNDEEDRALAYAEADYIYNSVRRRPPPAPMGAVMPMHPMPYLVEQPPPRLQRSSSNVVRRSIVLRTPTTSKMLPRPTPTSTLTSKASKSKKSVVYVTSESPRPNASMVKVGQEDDSSAKESFSDESDSETEANDEKMKRLQLRNLKRLRDKVKEEEEKLRAMKSFSANHRDVKEQPIGDDDDYDADCSALESPKKVNRVHQNLVNNGSLRSSRPRKSRSWDTSSQMMDCNPGGESNESKLMQLYHRRKKQQEQQLRSQFSAGDISKGFSADILKEVYGSKSSLLLREVSNDDRTGKFFQCQKSYSFF